MTLPIRTNLILGSGLVLGLVLSTFLPSAVLFAKPAKAMAMSEGDMNEHCKAMMVEKKAMIDSMKVQDMLLATQVEALNKAPESKKVALMAALLTHLVEQRISRDAHKAKMEEGMMDHMMKHMSMGKGSMKGCKMMPGMDDMKGMKGMMDKEEYEGNEKKVKE